MVPNVLVRRIGFYECRDFNLASLFRGVLRFSNKKVAHKSQIKPTYEQPGFRRLNDYTYCFSTTSAQREHNVGCAST